jgi:hypothetical protein
MQTKGIQTDGTDRKGVWIHLLKELKKDDEVTKIKERDEIKKYPTI